MNEYIITAIMTKGGREEELRYEAPSMYQALMEFMDDYGSSDIYPRVVKIIAINS